VIGKKRKRGAVWPGQFLRTGVGSADREKSTVLFRERLRAKGDSRNQKKNV